MDLLRYLYPDNHLRENLFLCSAERRLITNGECFHFEMEKLRRRPNCSLSTASSSSKYVSDSESQGSKINWCLNKEFDEFVKDDPDNPGRVLSIGDSSEMYEKDLPRKKRKRVHHQSEGNLIDKCLQNPVLGNTSTHKEVQPVTTFTEGQPGSKLSTNEGGAVTTLGKCCSGEVAINDRNVCGCWDGYSGLEFLWLGSDAYCDTKCEYDLSLHCEADIGDNLCLSEELTWIGSSDELSAEMSEVESNLQQTDPAESDEQIGYIVRSNTVDVENSMLLDWLDAFDAGGDSVSASNHQEQGLAAEDDTANEADFDSSAAECALSMDSPADNADELLELGTQCSSLSGSMSGSLGDPFSGSVESGAEITEDRLPLNRLFLPLPPAIPGFTLPAVGPTGRQPFTPQEDLHIWHCHLQGDLGALDAWDSPAASISGIRRTKDSIATHLSHLIALRNNTLQSETRRRFSEQQDAQITAAYTKSRVNLTALTARWGCTSKDIRVRNRQLKVIQHLKNVEVAFYSAVARITQAHVESTAAAAIVTMHNSGAQIRASAAGHHPQPWTDAIEGGKGNDAVECDCAGSGGCVDSGNERDRLVVTVVAASAPHRWSQLCVLCWGKKSLILVNTAKEATVDPSPLSSEQQ